MEMPSVTGPAPVRPDVLAVLCGVVRCARQSKAHGRALAVHTLPVNMAACGAAGPAWSRPSCGCASSSCTPSRAARAGTCGAPRHCPGWQPSLTMQMPLLCAQSSTHSGSGAGSAQGACHEPSQRLPPADWAMLRCLLLCASSKPASLERARTHRNLTLRPGNAGACLLVGAGTQQAEHSPG